MEEIKTCLTPSRPPPCLSTGSGQALRQVYPERSDAVSLSNCRRAQGPGGGGRLNLVHRLMEELAGEFLKSEHLEYKIKKNLQSIGFEI